MSPETRSRELLVHDVVLIGIMAVLAGCGLIYEYLLSHYAGRILGAVETTLFAMIGLMIVSMGLGSFAARAVKDPFTGFAWLEVFIALLGVSCILAIALLVALTSLLPEIIAATFGLPPDLTPRGGLFKSLQQVARFSPYVFGIVIGFLVGMEIPLIARVREEVYDRRLVHNAGTIYGADYLGAGAGAAIWVSVMLSIDITRAAVLTALANLAAGLLFLFRYWTHISGAIALASCHALVLVIALVFYQYGSNWSDSMTNMLYRDEVVYNQATRYQQLAITRRHRSTESAPVYGFYINGRLQFSSLDEHIYHSMLSWPAMAVADDPKNVLIIGGGDGLALRDVLLWNPESVELVDLDPALVNFFSPGPETSHLQRNLIDLNGAAFADKRVAVQFGDAFVVIDEFIETGRLFDVILVDLPDPSHPDLDRLYTDHFYGRLHHLLTDRGVMTIQSTSAWHARDAFLVIGNTVRASGFKRVEQFHQNIPSFGEWGWTIASKQPRSPREILSNLEAFPVAHSWLTPGILRGSFEFPSGFFDQADELGVNHLGLNLVYRYHQQAWRDEMGY